MDFIIFIYNINKNFIKWHIFIWIHPDLAIHLAMWVSVDFSIKINQWINEWKQINNNNSFSNIELLLLKPEDKNILKEKEIQLKLHNIIGGKIEVETEDGCI